jgi:hypothetical protein
MGRIAQKRCLKLALRKRFKPLRFCRAPPSYPCSRRLSVRKNERGNSVSSRRTRSKDENSGNADRISCLKLALRKRFKPLRFCRAPPSYPCSRRLSVRKNERGNSVSSRHTRSKDENSGNADRITASGLVLDAP